MNNEEYEKASQELTEKMNQYKDKMDASEIKKSISKWNQYYNQFFNYFLMMIYTSGLGTIAIRYFIPSMAVMLPKIVPALFAASFVSVGLGRLFIDNMYIIKEKYKDMKKGKTEEEKYQEELKYSIEYEKAYAKHEAYKEAKYMLGRHSRNQQIFEDKQFLEQRVTEKSKKLEEEEKELDRLCQKKALIDAYNKKDTIGYILYKMCFVAFGLHAMTVSNAIDAGLIPMYMGAAPVLLAVTVVGGLSYKRKKSIDKVLNDFNQELGEEAISLEKDHIERIRITNNQQLKEKEQEISDLKCELLTAKAILNMVNSSSKGKEQEKAKESQYLEDLAEKMVEEEENAIPEEKGTARVKTIYTS